jgi:hypothetical protein
MTVLYTITPRLGMASALYDVVPVDQLAGVVTSRDALVDMLKRLRIVDEAGWGAYQILPSSTVQIPTLATVKDYYVPGNVANYILWPAVEYAAWQAAWNHLIYVAKLFGTFAEFPLGNSAQIRDAVLTDNTYALQTFPTAERAASNLVSFLLRMQRTYENLPKPSVKLDEANGTKSKLGISPWTIVGVVSAVVVGGAIIYTHKYNHWPFRN